MSTKTPVASREGSAVFFDVDGTLANSFKLGFNSTNAVLTKNGRKEVSSDEFHKGTVYDTPSRFSWHVTGEANDVSGIGAIYGAMFDEYYVALVSNETAPLFPGISKLLEELVMKFPDTHLGALSNACGAYVKAVANANNFASQFSLLYGSDDVPDSKPSPDGLLFMCKELDVKPERCVYVGDAPTDGKAAAQAGFAASIGVTWGSHAATVVRDCEHFTHTVDNVDELNRLLLNLLKTH
mgnify:CR=1 FL=1